MLPGWYGFGSAVKAFVAAASRRRARRCCRRCTARWPFFRTLLSNMDMVLAKIEPRHRLALRRAGARRRAARSDLRAHLAASGAIRSTRSTRSWSSASCCESNPLLARSIRNRFPYLDPLNHVQVELLQAAPRRSAVDEQVLTRHPADDQRHLGGVAQQRVKSPPSAAHIARQQLRRRATQARRRRGDRMTRLLYRLFHGPAWLTFPAMGLAAGAVALCSFNLFELFRANFRLLATYGLMAALDGGALQLVELVVLGLSRPCLLRSLQGLSRRPADARPPQRRTVAALSADHSSSGPVKTLHQPCRLTGPTTSRHWSGGRNGAQISQRSTPCGMVLVGDRGLRSLARGEDAAAAGDGRGGN